MRCFLYLMTVLSLGLSGGLVADADDASDIKHVIPSDSAMMHADFERIASGQSIPSSSKFQDKSLTLMLLALKVKDDQKAKAEFRFLTDGYPKPSALASELFHERRTGKRGILLRPVTFIQSDRITDFTCDVKADKATGTVSFNVPNLYQGKVKYVARKLDTNWFITEFIMPAHGIHLIRSDDGLWKEKS